MWASHKFHHYNKLIKIQLWLKIRPTFCLTVKQIYNVSSNAFVSLTLFLYLFYASFNKGGYSPLKPLMLVMLVCRHPHEYNSQVNIPHSILVRSIFSLIELTNTYIRFPMSKMLHFSRKKPRLSCAGCKLFTLPER